MAADLEGQAELEEEREFLLRSLRDLEQEHAAGDIDEHDYESLKGDYTARAAGVLRAIEDGRPPAEPERRRPSGRRTVVAVAAVLVVALGAGALVATSAGERVAGRPSSGSIREGSNDRLAQARSLVAGGKAVEAVKLYDQILADDPRNAEAWTYRGWIIRLAGLSDQGLESIDKGIAADPGYPDAHFFKGVILFRDRNDPAAAVTELKLFLAQNPAPDMKATVESLLQEAQEKASAPAGASGVVK
jgi:tetratricopeptide (TPR) repeat protein